jgi:hypothetical protein
MVEGYGDRYRQGLADRHAIAQIRARALGAGAAAG